MAKNKIECRIHGESYETFVCSHLTGGSAGLGFNRDEPTESHPFPDAWCDDCEIILTAHGGWNHESEKLVEIKLLCSGCYEQARIRNTRTSVTLDDLKDTRWKCGSCDKWHTGPCLDFGYDAPHYWSRQHGDAMRRAKSSQDPKKQCPDIFLNEDICVIEDRDFFVRGIIPIPIIGTAEHFRWGVWGSLSKTNFEKLLEMDDDPKRSGLPPMFSWLSNQIPEYPDTLSLKMHAHIQEVGQRPHFELEATDHPLSQEYQHGIEPERVKEIMMGRLRGK